MTAMATDVHHDLDELRQRKIAVPAVFSRGAWVMVALGAGDGGAPGPAATQLLLWLPVGAWAEVDAAIGPRGAASSRTVPVAAAALWNGGDGPEVATAHGALTVHGDAYPVAAFGNVFWTHGWALGTRAGLLVSLVNG